MKGLWLGPLLKVFVIGVIALFMFDLELKHKVVP